MEVAELKREVRDVFDPLAVRLNLSGPVETSMATTEFSLGYMGHTLGIQVSVDMSQFFIHVLLFRPSDDKIPIGYTDIDGRTQKVYLQQALKTVSISTEQETQALRKLAGNYMNCTSMAKILADLVEHHWPLISGNVTKWFSE
jgi:hypothetical protein